MVRSSALIASALCATAAMLPAVADGATFRGKTRQGKPVSLVTRADGSLRWQRIKWTARCHPGSFTNTTELIPPFDFSVPGRFRDGSPPSYNHPMDDGLHARVKVQSSGHVGAHGRWRGRLRADVGIFRGTNRIATCHVRDDTWTATRVRR